MAKTVSDLTHTGQVNSFTGGLNTDLHPLVQPNDTLTDCINGTLITYNGNENMLQNDMGNYALEGSELPDGFIPLGMKEHNGVAYIVSHNPMTKEVQIGSYPSPKLTTDENGKKLESTPIPMYAVDNKNYTYKSCSDALCLEAQKSAETDYVDFDITINFGDIYELSKMDENTDFQQEQFSILEDSGKITNIYPIADDKPHSVDWTSSGKLLKKYILNKVTNFQQEVNWTLPEPPIQSRIVGGDDTVLTPDDEYIYPKPDLQSITIKNTLSFNRIDVNWEDTSEVYVGIVYEIVTGDPYLFTLGYSGAECVKTHKINVLQKWDGKTKTFDFKYVLDSENIYFLRNWKIIDPVNEDDLPKINGPYMAPIQVNSYPILIHRVDNEDRSVILYDNSKQVTQITKLDAKGGFTFQYYCDYDSNTKNYSIYMSLNSKNDEFTTNLFYLQSDGSLLSANQLNNEQPIFQTQLEFKWDSVKEMLVAECNTTDSVIFIEFEMDNQWYYLPIITKIDEDLYGKYKLYYDNFCLIPGQKLWEFGDDECITIGDSKKTDYVKLVNNKLTRYNAPFNTSIYMDDNVNTCYGDVNVGTIKLNNIVGDKVTVELQKLNSDNVWETILSKLYITEKGTVEIENAILSSNVNQAIAGDEVENCVERIYLAKHGHAPFAFTEGLDGNVESWKQRFSQNTGFDESLFDKLRTYADWDNKKSLYVGKHCGKRNNEFIVQKCNCFGKADDELLATTCSTELQWSDEFNSLQQLFVPVKAEVGCLSANIDYPTQRRPETGLLNSHETGQGKYITILARTETTPHLTTHISLIPVNNENTNIAEFEKWLLYLYTHVFYYKRLQSSAQKFVLIKNDTDQVQFRYNIVGTFGQYININGKSYKFDEYKLNSLHNIINCKCNNFDYYDAKNSIVYPIINQESSSRQWSYINSIVQSNISDEEIIKTHTVNNVPQWQNMLFIDDLNTVVDWKNPNINNDNIAHCRKMLFNFNFDYNNYSKITYVPLSEPICAAFICSGNLSAGVTLANMTATGSGSSNKYDHYKTDKLVLEAVEEYQLSPRFKQIINYGTEN